MGNPRTTHPKKLTATTRNEVQEDGHTHEIERASLTQAGIVQLNASIQSTSTTEAATPSAVKTAYDKATAAEQLAQTKQAALITHTIDLSALDQDKYYLVTFSSSGNLNNGQRWPFSILRPLNNRQNPRWGTHNNGFSLQLYWTSNADGWGTNRLYRTIDTFEYEWTRDNQSPVLSVGQMRRGAFEHCYLRGGTIYWAETLPGFTVQVHTESYTHAGEIRQSPIEFSPDLVPIVDLKQLKADTDGLRTDLASLNNEAVRHKRLTTTTPNSQTSWDAANPNELPSGTAIGFGQRAWLNTNGDVYSGWQMVSKLDEVHLSVRFGMNAGRFFYQQAKNDSEWGEAIEAMGARRLSVENLNNITNIGFYGQNLNVNATTDRNYPVGLAGSLVVMPSAYGVMQEYTTFYTGHKFSRGRDGDGWLAWKRIDGVVDYQKINNFEVRKYPDGTMIQTFSYEENDLAVWSEKAFSWAAAFVERPMMFAQITTSYGGSHDCGVNILTKSTSGRVFYHYYEHGNPNQGLCLVQFLAIGRWK